MASKIRKRPKSKIRNTEIRTPINLQQIANSQKSLLIQRPDTQNLIPFLKTREFSPAIVRSSAENSLRASHSTKRYTNAFLNHVEKPKIKIPLKIEVSQSIEDFSKDMSIKESEDEEFEIYNKELEKLKIKEDQVIDSAEDTYQITSNKYKSKYKKKLQSIIEKQNERHKFQIETLTKNYETKIGKYKEIIEKLHQEIEEISHGNSPNKNLDLVSPLIEENLWLKQQLSVLKASFKK